MTKFAIIAMLLGATVAAQPSTSLLKDSRRDAHSWVRNYSIYIQFDGRDSKQHFMELFDSDTTVVYNNIAPETYGRYATSKSYATTRRSLRRYMQPRHHIVGVRILHEEMTDSTVQTEIGMTQQTTFTGGRYAEQALRVRLCYDAATRQTLASSIVCEGDSMPRPNFVEAPSIDSSLFEPLPELARIAESKAELLNLAVQIADEIDEENIAQEIAREDEIDEEDIIEEEAAPERVEPTIKVKVGDNNIITISVMNEEEEYASATIYDSMGRKVKEFNMGTEPATWCRWKATPGKYFIDVRVGSTMKNETVIIL